MNLIILTENDRVDDHTYQLSDRRAEHILTILKRKTGETLEVGLLNGPVGTGRLIEMSHGCVTIRTEEMYSPPAPAMTVDLICALPRPQTLKKVLLTCGMMQVRRLCLIRANRVEKSFFQSPLLQPERRYRHLLDGLAQGKHTRLPQVSVHDRFRRFFEDELNTLEQEDASPALRLVPEPSAGATLSNQASIPKRITLAFGPEGGWVDFERNVMKQCGFFEFCLGRSILRVEYAVVAALSQLELLAGIPPKREK